MGRLKGEGRCGTAGVATRKYKSGEMWVERCESGYHSGEVVRVGRLQYGGVSGEP